MYVHKIGPKQMFRNVMTYIENLSYKSYNAAQIQTVNKKYFVVKRVN